MIPGLYQSSWPTIGAVEPQASSGVPQVVFHGFLSGNDVSNLNSYGEGDIDGAKNVTGYVTEIQWMHSIRAPYETMQMTLRGPEAHLQSIFPGSGIPGRDREVTSADGYKLRNPSVGFWAVIYLPNRDTSGATTWSAAHWGRCNAMTFDVQTDDNGVLMVTARLEFESWVATLQKSSIFLAPGSTYIQEGYSYDFQSWADNLSTIATGYAGVEEYGGVHTVFRDLFRSLLACSIPNTLTSFTGQFFAEDVNGSTRVRYGTSADAYLARVGETGDLEARDLGRVDKRPYIMSDVIAFVGGKSDCLVYAPLRLTQHKEVTGDGIGNLANVFPRGSQWSFFESTFFPVPEVIECFPSLEWPVMWGFEGPARAYEDAHNSPTGNSVTLQTAYQELREQQVESGDGPLYYHDTDRRRFTARAAESLSEDLAAEVRLVNDMSSYPRASYGTVPAPFGGKPEELGGVEDLDEGQYLSLHATRAAMCKAMGGSMPVLIYRMRPSNLFAISQEELTQALRARYSWADGEQVYRLVAREPASQRNGLNQAATAISPFPNVRKPDGEPEWLWYVHAAEETLKLSRTANDQEAFNGVYVKTPLQPNSQMELHGMLGEVMVDNNSVNTRGLRMKTIDWPFFPAGLTTDRSESSFATKIECLTEEVYSAVADPYSVYGRGTVEIAYKPWLKAGFWTTGVMPADHGKPVVDPQKQASRPDLRMMGPRGSLSSYEGYPGWSGYIEAVQHVVRVLPDGRVMQRTTLQLSKFLTIGFGQFLQQFPYRPQGWGYREHPFIYRNGQQITGHIYVDPETGVSEFREGPAPEVGP